MSAAALSKRFVAAAGGTENGAQAVVLDGANHNLSEPAGAADAFVKLVGDVLGEVGGGA